MLCMILRKDVQKTTDGYVPFMAYGMTRDPHGTFDLAWVLHDDARALSYFVHFTARIPPNLIIVKCHRSAPNGAPFYLVVSVK